ncbi:MAG: D-alanine--D-alanine ligase, partial [Rhodospirillales bacterium]|nr:D-alanine--D-alanine ligase [Rhodospirillales bacterium]
MMASKRVVVLHGGTSDEREISLRSGAAVVDALDASGLQVDAFDPRFGVQALARAVEPSGTIVFNALHGGTGENGSVQGLLEVMGVPYTHSGVRASALAMDKPASRDIFATHGLTVANGLVVCRDELAASDPMPRP